VNDPVVREDSLTEPLHHVVRTYGFESLPGEVEVRRPSGWARAVTEAKGLELQLAGLALAQMRFQRDLFRQPNVLVEKRREQLASVLAIHGTPISAAASFSDRRILQMASGRSNLKRHPDSRIQTARSLHGRITKFYLPG
jgi:hypothetical protein